MINEEHQKGDAKRLWHRKRKGQSLTSDEQEQLDRQEKFNTKVEGIINGDYNCDIHFGSVDSFNAK